MMATTARAVGSATPRATSHESQVPARIPEFGPYMSIALAAHSRYLEGDSAGALDDTDRALRFVRGVGDTQTERFLRYTQCTSLREQGRHAEVVERATALLEMIGDDDPVWRAKVLAVSAHALASLSRTAQAMDAISEAEHLLQTHGAGTYNAMSATLSLVIALQPLRVYELADQILADLLRAQPQHATYICTEACLVRAAWAATLQLSGDEAGASAHYLACGELALRTRQAALDAEDSRFALVRAIVCEAFVLERLGDPLAARALMHSVTEEDLRADYPEHDLAYLTVGRVSFALGEHDRARRHFERVVGAAERAGRDLWRSVALDALAELEVAEHGPHPATHWWRAQMLSLQQRSLHEASTRTRELRERALMRQLRETSDRMSKAALMDPLTGLANRRALQEWLLEVGDDRGAVFVDVDHFKQVNDSFSHEVGDQVLQQVAALLARSVRGDDLVARFGGDEFVVVTAGGEIAAHAVAQRAHSAVLEHDWSELAPGLHVTVSIGVALQLDPADPLGQADGALYAAKRAGRNRVAVAG